MDLQAAHTFASKAWEDEIIPTLSEFISIPNQSPMFDKEWATNGHTFKAVDLLVNWVKKQNVEGLSVEVVRIEERTPVIFVEIAATKKDNANTVMLYGHMDKQPPLTKDWDEGLHPYKPVIKDGKLYGRGGADDGYAIFGSVTAIQALKKQNVAHDRYVIIIEAAEESGSPDLPYYIEHLSSRIGIPALVVCLDSGCGNYEQFWMTSSLRGLLAGNLEVKILREGVHSGSGSGIIPSSFRIIRMLLERVENTQTGELIKDLHVEIPSYRIEQAKQTAGILGPVVHNEFPFVGKATPISEDLVELLLNRSWRPTLCMTGIEGLPTLESAGNVLRPYTSVKLSIRLPPTLSAAEAGKRLKAILEKDPPYGAQVSFNPDKTGDGWESPALHPWIEKAIGEASETLFKKPHAYMGEGGSIPFMGMLGKRFPKAQFIITGLLGPGSNAHGPNEFLHIDMGKKVTAIVAYLLAHQAQH
eukprot:TRINITY_DN1629_c0_g1_i1.p1 TRINITY_DN1629_c0_g1~~TRINITY_DN1629_c0_g1_i1.p1  ORF type:complete len:472 (-),score=146.28 TRINITY_DN1629_c0_g1_i1:257-1672(-)